MEARTRALPLVPRACREVATPRQQAIFLAAIVAFGASCVLGLVAAWGLWQRPPGIGIDHSRLWRDRVKAGAWAEAAREMRAAQRIDWTNRVGAIDLAEALERAGDVPGAIAALKEAAAANGGDPMLYSRLARLLQSTGRFDEAQATVDEFIRLDPSNAQGYLARGNLFFQKREVEPALIAYRQALALDPLLANAEHGLGAVYLVRGELDESLAAYQRALLLDPRMPSAHNGVGLVHLQRGQAAEARASFEEALRLDPGSRSARQNLEKAESMLAAKGPSDG
jgi:tetratricopeptide (TPR) repeat protein